MTVKLTGDVMRDTQIFAQEAFRAMRDPDEDLLAVLLFWREAKLTHVEASTMRTSWTMPRRATCSSAL